MHVSSGRDRYTGGQIDKQTDRQTYRQRHIHVDINETQRQRQTDADREIERGERGFVNKERHLRNELRG